MWCDHIASECDSGHDSGIDSFRH